VGAGEVEAASGEEVVRVETGEFDHAAFTPDGRGVALADKTNLHVWDAVTGESLHQMAWPESVAAKVCCLALFPGGRAVTGMEDGDILIWDLAAATWPARTPVRDLGGEELNTRWNDLADDARKAHRAIDALATVPAQTVPFLKAHLQPVTVDAKRIEKLLADLDSDSFQTREAAAQELIRMRYRAEPMLRRTLKANPALEIRRRLQAILAESQRLPAEALRTLRSDVRPFALVGEWAGGGAVLGHLFPVGLGFRVGKGVATGLGVLLAVAWPVGVLWCAAWLATAKLARLSSLAALVALALPPLFAWALASGGVVKLSLAVAVLVFARHHANIRRLLAGQEPRIGPGT